MNQLLRCLLLEKQNDSVYSNVPRVAQTTPGLLQRNWPTLEDAAAIFPLETIAISIAVPHHCSSNAAFVIVGIFVEITEVHEDCKCHDEGLVLRVTDATKVDVEVVNIGCN